MRILKFRQWNPSDKAFHYWGYTDEDDTFISPIYGESQQFTGLLDKQGKEISEGDIILGKRLDRYTTEIGNGEQRVAVEYYEAGFYPFADSEDNEPYPKPDEVEVIGNIYENPELLKSPK